MCGIAGVLGLPRIDGHDAIGRMVRALTHRGPDDQGVYAVDDVAIGARRLSILDLSPAGHQPLWSADGRFAIVYNGEVYNFRSVAADLKRESGFTPRSQSDTEIVVEAYARWGVAALSRLRGMFAFAIWDAARQELFVARDRLGIKPLYYYGGDGVFVFSSEVRALLETGLVPRRLDPTGVWDYLACQAVPPPRTLVDNVRALEPGAWLKVRADGLVTEAGTYWDLLKNVSPDAAKATPAQARQRIGELLRESIDLHMVSDVPVGAFFSGGVDSTAVVSLMCQANRRPRTFTVGCWGFSEDETRHAGSVATHFGTQHTEVRFREQDLLDQLPSALAAMDQATGDGINTYLISGAVRRAGITVALSGLGGDEFFGGYSIFSRIRRARPVLPILRYVPDAARQLLARGVRSAGQSIAADKLASVLERDVDLTGMVALSRRVLSPSQRRSLFSDSWLLLLQDAQERPLWRLERGRLASRQTDLFSWISYGEARGYMHDVLLRDTDQMSMAHSLEVRVPLLDHPLVEYVMGLPDALKTPRGMPKQLLVDSLNGSLPQAVVNRSKQGFTLPFGSWMRGAFRAFCEERLSERRLGSRGIFRPEILQRLWRGFMDRDPSLSWSRLWVLVALEEWIERNGMTAI